MKTWQDKARQIIADLNQQATFYFEPQTGIVKSTPIRSNFYVFRLPKACLAKVQLAVNEAGLDCSGLTYQPEFIEWLSKHDTKWDQKTGLAVPFCERDYK